MALLEYGFVGLVAFLGGALGSLFMWIVVGPWAVKRGLTNAINRAADDEESEEFKMLATMASKMLEIADRILTLKMTQKTFYYDTKGNKHEVRPDMPESVKVLLQLVAKYFHDNFNGWMGSFVKKFKKEGRNIVGDMMGGGDSGPGADMMGQIIGNIFSGGKK